MLCGQLLREQLAQTLLQLALGQVAVAVRVPEPKRIGVALPCLVYLAANLLCHLAPLAPGRRIPAHESKAYNGMVQREQLLLCEVAHHLVQDPGLQWRDLDPKPRQERLKLAQGHGAIPVGVEELLQVRHGRVHELPPQRGDLAQEVRLGVLLHGPAAPDLEAVQEADVADRIGEAPAARQMLEQCGREDLVAERLQQPQHHLGPDGLGQQPRHGLVVGAELLEELVLALADPLDHELQDLVVGPGLGLGRGVRRAAGRGVRVRGI
mmetsp:Transcript_12346/g.35011  ORF Transcript_12346/g.35011 Transcript_12346/m.35011 type:complete len:266 (+) Transcript_12346:501-1298(+)